MALTWGRIGKSLLKYFKPVRYTPPHLPGQKVSYPGIDDQTKKRFTPFRLARAPATTEEARAAQPEPGESLPVPVREKLPPPKQWLDLVITLLAACRRTSMLMTKKIGLQTYQRIMDARGGGRIRKVGNIIDTTPIAAETAENGKEAA